MKSHFQFTNQQRNGIFLLILISVVLQLVYHFTDFSEDYTIDKTELEGYRNEIDSLQSIAVKKPKLYPFNPNYITDYKGYTLGMSIEEIERLHSYRAKNLWVNSVKQFQDVTKVSDSLLNVISPLFKFPDWVTKSQKSKENSTNSFVNKPKNSDKQDLNTATTAQLQSVYGVGEKLSQRIIKYRDKQKGFISDVELIGIYGLKSEVIQQIKKRFTVLTPRKIAKYNLNTATRDELVTIPFIDYEIAKHIIEERTLRDGFKSLNTLLKVEDFPVNKIDIIKLYLYL